MVVFGYMMWVQCKYDLLLFCCCYCCTHHKYKTTCDNKFFHTFAMKQSKGNNLPTVLCLYVYNRSQCFSGNSVT